mgnify:CR=1 FL=1
MSGWRVFEILINIYQGFLLIYFINRVTHAEEHPLWIDCVFIGTISIFLSSYLFIDIPFIDTFVFIIPFVHALFVSKERWYAKLFWAAVLAGITLGTITLISNMFMLLIGVPWDVILGEKQYRISYVIFCNLCLFLVIFFIAKLCSNKKTVSITSFIIFLILNALQLLSIELLFKIGIERGIVSIEFEIVNICILGASIFSLILYELMARTTFQRQEAESKLQILQQSQDHQKELRNMYSAMLQYQHDLRHKYQILEEIINNNKIISEETRSLMKNADDNNPLDKMFITGNVFVDALLIAKKVTMDIQKIRFECVIYPLTHLPLQEMDFCILLSNLLDNAIEAVQRLPLDAESRLVQLKFARVQDNFIIVCQNDYLPASLRFENNRYISSKPNKAMHGYGLENIRRICEDAKGNCTVMHDKKFVIRIILPLSDNKKKGK